MLRQSVAIGVRGGWRGESLQKPAGKQLSGILVSISGRK